MRGSGAGKPSVSADVRFIPARAGIGGILQLFPLLGSVHPRSCGDRRGQLAYSLSTAGSSPLVRGSVIATIFFVPIGRFIPARAGIGPHLSTPETTPAVHPRSCGDRTSRFLVKHGAHGSSPLVRGSGALAALPVLHGRFIPARAGIGWTVIADNAPGTVHPRSCGDRLEAPSIATKTTVHPRSCGDRDSVLVGRRADAGSSPLVRGSVGTPMLGKILPRFIPARAGIGLKRTASACGCAVHPRSCGDQHNGSQAPR